MGFHPRQVCYFVAFTLGMSAPYCFSLAHPYLLADNRHYTFYIWRRIIARNNFTKFFLLPLYILGGYCVLNTLRHNTIIFKSSFPLFTCLNLAPQALLEFRYF